MNSSDTGLGCVLPLDDSTFNNILQSKHPEGSPKNANLPFQRTGAVIYDQITPKLIIKYALKTKGVEGPFCSDGGDWKRVIGINTCGTDWNDCHKAIAEITDQL